MGKINTNWTYPPDEHWENDSKRIGCSCTTIIVAVLVAASALAYLIYGN